MNAIITAITLTLLVFACAGASAAQKATLEKSPLQTVTVKQVVDGDTFITTNGEHIRLWGINAPEKNEAGYWPAGMFLDIKVRGEQLKCRLIDMDKYKRSVMQCNKSGVDIGSYMVQTGYARDFSKYSKGFYQVDEEDAKQAKRGMWNPENGIDPDLKYTPY